jgi:hypothetical protein
LVDFFVDIVKKEIPDPGLRDRIARAILERIPNDPVEENPAGKG